jgi:hypothetical protein
MKVERVGRFTLRAGPFTGWQRVGLGLVGALIFAGVLLAASGSSNPGGLYAACVLGGVESVGSQLRRRRNRKRAKSPPWSGRSCCGVTSSGLGDFGLAFAPQGLRTDPN